MDEKTVTMMEGVAREWRVRVQDAAGNVLDPAGFSFYGAAADGVQVPRRMQVRVEGDVVVLVLPGLWMSGRCWRYQVLCQDVLTGVEWVLCQGDVVLERRVACNGPALHEDAVLVDAVLDSEATVMDVVLGDSTAASAEAARLAEAARAGADEAALRVAGDAARVEELKRVTLDVAAGAALAAERAEDSKRGAEAAAGDAVADAQLAEDAAAEAEVSREAAEAAAKQAGARAAEAEASAKVGADAVSDALAARDEAAAARGGAEAAMRAAGARAGEAEDFAEAAGVARAGAEDAQVKAEQAKDGAELAKVKAEQEAVKAEQNAALLGDAALKGGNNTFTGSNVFSGAISGNGTLFGMELQKWLGLSGVLRGVPLTKSLVKYLFPNSASMTVSPFLDWTGNQIQPHDDEWNRYMWPNLEYVYSMQTDVGNQPGFPCSHTFPKMKELWHLNQSTGHYIIVYKTNCNSHYFFPNWTTTLMRFQIYCKDKLNIDLFIPKMTNVTLMTEHYGNVYSGTWNILGSNSIKKLEFSGSGLTLTLTNFNLQKCTNLTIKSGIKIERVSLLDMLNSLPAYDAATMTTQPTASLYVTPGYQGDEEITAALLNLQAAVEDGGKGWTVAVTGITLTEAATFALRTMYYYARREDADGAYIDSTGQRWDVSGGTTVLHNYAANEEVDGYSAFLSLEDALEEWGLHEITPEESKADYERRHGKD